MKQDKSAKGPEGNTFPEKLAPLFRSVESLEIRADDDDRMTIMLSASSETPVERWFGDEILSHEDGAIRLDRVSNGSVPLLFNHDWDGVIGMVDSARVENSKLMVEAHLFDTQRAKEVRSMIEGGLRNVSIGYRLHVVEENKDTDTFTARDWEPYEVSIVSIPADPTVGIGRKLGEELEVRMLRASAGSDNTANTAARRAEMSEESTVTAGENAANEQHNVTAMQAEKGRRAAIAAMCKANKIDSRAEATWIRDGTPIEDVIGDDGEIKTKGVARQILDVMEERGKARPAIASELGLSKGETNRYSLFKAIRALHYGNKDSRAIEQAGFEIECSKALSDKLNRGSGSSLLVPAEVLMRPMQTEVMERAMVNRAMATTPGASGGYLVNVENMGFIDILRNRSVARSMGARVLSGLEGNVMFPRQTGKNSVTWQAGEHTSVTAGDQTLGQLSMTPKTAIAITDVSEQLLRQSSPSAEQFVMADLAADIAIDGVDLAALKGTGGAQPIGIYNTTGVDTGQDASSVTYAKILAFPVSAGSNNAIRGNPGFVTDIAGASVLMQEQRFSNTDTPLWEGNLMDGSCIGFRAMSSEQLATGELIFGSWDELVIGEWGVLELSTDTGGTRFNSATVGIRAMWMVDVMIRYPQAFVVSTNLAA